MTMVHFGTKPISRKAGQSAVACAAYRAADILYDAKYGKTHDYSKKAGVMSSDIVLPLSLKTLGMRVNRETLWNTAEAAERRSDSRVAREWLINLPYELSEEDRHTLAINFAQKLCDDMDVIADVCIHRPVMKLPFDPNAKPSSKRLREGEENPDPRNFHAHILVTTRSPTIGSNKTLTFDPKLKIPFEWSNTKRNANNLPSSIKEIKRIRELWVDTANKVLEQYGLPLMDARSYEDQGLNQQPTIKMGVEATAMERRGIRTEKGNTNRAIVARNQSVAENTIQQGLEHERRSERFRDGLAWATEHNEGLSDLITVTKQRVDSTQRRIRDTKSGHAWATERCERIPNVINTVNNRIRSTNDAIKWADDHSESFSKLIRDTKSMLEWTAKRCENLPKRSDETKQRTDFSKHWVTANAKRAASSESIAETIIQGVKNREKPAPSPFDDTYRRAFLERKRHIDQQLREARFDAIDREYDTKRIANALREKKNSLAFRLLARNNEKYSLRKGRNDNPKHYPDKFDYRQVAVLNKLAFSLGIHTMREDLIEKNKRVADMLNIEVMENNLDAIDILIDKQSERAHYNNVTSDFHTFLERLDSKRSAKNKALQQSLGRGNISHMISEIQTAPSYLDRLTEYMNKDSTAYECTQLAKTHITKTLTKTCIQYKLSYQGLNILDNVESAQRHIETLEASLRTFITKYEKKLTNDNLSNIKEGLQVLERGDQIQSRLRSTFRP